MLIKSLELDNYRNYKNLKIDFDKGVNILYGNNAQGKTNILEAIYMSSTAKSHKGSKDRDIVNFDANEGHIKTLIEKDGMERRIDMHLRKSMSKGVAVDKVRIKKCVHLLSDKYANTEQKEYLRVLFLLLRHTYPSVKRVYISGVL